MKKKSINNQNYEQNIIINKQEANQEKILFRT